VSDASDPELQRVLPHLWDEYLERFTRAVGERAVGAFAKHAGHLIKKLSFEEFASAYLEYSELLASYHSSLARGDTINDIILKLLRERAANLVLPAPAL
jgi:hypothetical protein